MPRPPRPTNRTYRGRIRADMRTAKTHLVKILTWNVVYNSKPITYYPNQLFDPGTSTTLQAALTALINLLASKGPIPSR